MSQVVYSAIAEKAFLQHICETGLFQQMEHIFDVLQVFFMRSREDDYVVDVDYNTALLQYRLSEWFKMEKL